ncbi:cytochrome aa3 quinol oxidase subunit IV [Neobacillus notoginsengisoli]|uniref:Quinol oxidase subunit 4 n=1 Tax=Neobacillus notoginsengisoli TaxID=1578198 RepID=A0A417YRU5_9BACI|nr:cytochrome aa3 quinol oxidase subunit IV [Neobacillus notoginsengisoli]RHW38012.1 cytochrome aa3 quinol oxidase subunit IV [Neobacillus notoginsengisoli]
MNQHAKRFPISHVFGFFLSLILTFGAAWVALMTSLPPKIIMWFIGSLAFIQASIQLLLFMHMREGENKTVNSINMLYAFFLAFVIVAGSIWVLTSGHSH